MGKSPRLLLGDEERLQTVSQYMIHEAQDGDLLLWEPTSLWGHAIAWWTGGPFSHISVALRLDGWWFSSGLEEKSGRGVNAPLCGEVGRWPRKISVYRVNELNERTRLAFRKCCLESLTASYAWPYIWVLAFSSNCFTLGIGKLLAWINGPCYRRLMDSVERARKENTGAICSSHVHKALSLSLGRRVIVKHDSAEVTPNQFGISGETAYVCTLVPDYRVKTRVVRPGSTVLGVLLFLLCLLLGWQVWRLF